MCNALMRANERDHAPPLCARMVAMIVEIEEGQRTQSQANLNELHALLVSN